jgi:hypothetical protein
MTFNDKLDDLQSNHIGDWLRVRQQVEDEMSGKQMPFCVCGRLATGLHESSCRKFQGKVRVETVKRLNYLFKKVTL